MHGALVADTIDPLAPRTASVPRPPPLAQQVCPWRCAAGPVCQQQRAHCSPCVPEWHQRAAATADRHPRLPQGCHAVWRRRTTRAPRLADRLHQPTAARAHAAPSGLRRCTSVLQRAARLQRRTTLRGSDLAYVFRGGAATVRALPRHPRDLVRVLGRNVGLHVHLLWTWPRGQGACRRLRWRIILGRRWRLCPLPSWWVLSG